MNIFAALKKQLLGKKIMKHILSCEYSVKFSDKLFLYPLK